MNRRDVLHLLALSGAWLVSLKAKALAQAGDQTPTLPGAAAEQAQARGFPADWSFVAPRQWNRVEQSLTRG